MRLIACLLPLALAACASPDVTPQTPRLDASASDAPHDAGAPDGSGDAGAPDAPGDAGAPDAPGDARPDEDAGSSFALTLSYSGTQCAGVDAVAFNDGGARQNEICDRGRLAAARYATVRDCAAALTDDPAILRRIADDGAYMNPSRHPERDAPCSRFSTLYPVEQVQRAVWCLRHAGQCNDDGSPR